MVERHIDDSGMFDPQPANLTLAQQFALHLGLSFDQQQIAAEIERDIKIGRVADDAAAFGHQLYNRLGSLSYRLDHPDDVSVNQLHMLDPLPDDTDVVAAYMNVQHRGIISGGPQDGALDLRTSVALIRRSPAGILSVSGPSTVMAERYRAHSLKRATPPLQGPPNWTYGR